MPKIFGPSKTDTETRSNDKRIYLCRPHTLKFYISIAINSRSHSALRCVFIMLQNLKETSDGKTVIGERIGNYKKIGIQNDSKGMANERV